MVLKSAGYSSPMNDPRGYLTASQVWHIIDTARTARNKLLIMTLFMTGRRVSEIVGYKKQVFEDGKWRVLTDIMGGLMPKDILPDRNAIVFTILKKGKPIERVIGVHSSLKATLNEYIRDNKIPDDRLVFPLTRQRVFQIVRDLGEKSGIPKVGNKGLHPHHFRHSFAVFMTDKINLKKLQEMLCHSDVAMTTHYLQYSSRDIEKDIEDAWS